MQEKEAKTLHALMIYGNVREQGFVHGSLDLVSRRLENLGMRVDRLHLREANIQYCTGCFHCLRHGNCVIEDDMQDIIRRIDQADALMTGASVRIGTAPALYKTFVERITYTVGFTRMLRDKQISAIGAVGIATGKKELGRMLLISPFYPRRVDYLFFRTGIPTRISPEDVRIRLEKAADNLYDATAQGRKAPLQQRLMRSVDDLIVRNFMLKKNTDHTYDHVVKVWREAGVLK
jgi:multimeric flavodoxin WrbA